ncbi:C39 family peptidase [Terricaulis sp.]|uniref:C39 family peptidase n=1 Tax=Terricaulis sp. TaxID=2768686 RepID=UPI003784AD4B
MNGQDLTQHFAPLRLWRGGVLLALAAAMLAIAMPAQAQEREQPRAQPVGQVRFHGQLAGGSYTMPVLSWREIPFRTVVRQQYDYSCGSAAVATLLAFHYGVEVRETDVFAAMYERGDQARIREVGFSMLDMRNYLETRGFRADGLRLSLDRLAELDIPTIALITHDNYRHFVVVKGVSETEVLVGDPTFGLVRYTREDFQRVWNGVVLAVRHTPEGAPDPFFNEGGEWAPWSVAPLGDDTPWSQSPSRLYQEMPEVYQITPLEPGAPS